MTTRARTPRGRRNETLWILLAMLIVPALVLGCRPRPEPQPAADETVDETVDEETVANDENCAASLAWIEDPSEPDAGAFEATSNCSFHQWAYQTFLWLTSEDPATGNLVFEGFASPGALFRPDGPDGPYPGRDPAIAGSALMFARTAKSRNTVDPDQVFQAGPGNKILVDQNGEVVYFSSHLDETYWDFIDRNEFYKLANLRNADPDTNFDVGSLELKASWRVAEKDGKTLIENAEDRFYVVQSVIPTVGVNEKGMIVENMNDMIPAKMALVGLHVTGVVEGHPEFIWATFEHRDNAPFSAEDRKKPAADGPGPTGPWSFYKPGTPTDQTNQFDVNDPLAVVNASLVHPQGGGSDDNRNAVVTLNDNVRALLGSSLWANYELGGAVWTSGQVPLSNGAFSATDKAAGATQLGSLDLANTTLETFTQNDNCFACHNGGAHTFVVGSKATSINHKNINLSHFVVYYQAVEQTKKGE